MITEVLVTALKAEASITGLGTPPLGERIYPGSLPDAVTYPAVMISKVGGAGESDFQGDAGIERARVQIDVLGLGYADVVAIKRAIRTVMLRRPPIGPACIIDSVHCITDTDMPAQAPITATASAGPPRLRRRMLEFLVWTRP